MVRPPRPGWPHEELYDGQMETPCSGANEAIFPIDFLSMQASPSLHGIRTKTMMPVAAHLRAGTMAHPFLAYLPAVRPNPLAGTWWDSVASPCPMQPRRAAPTTTLT